MALWSLFWMTVRQGPRLRRPMMLLQPPPAHQSTKMPRDLYPTSFLDWEELRVMHLSTYGKFSWVIVGMWGRSRGPNIIF